MKTKFLLSITLLLLFSCDYNTPKLYQTETLKLQAISEHVWQHTSYLNTQSFGKVECNGILVIDDEEAVLIDTPTDAESTEELYNWLQENDIELKAVVPTHFHVDCTAGLNFLHKKGVESYGSYLTLLNASRHHQPIPQNAFKDSLTIMVDDHEVKFKYFGKGHTTDNITAYIPSDKVLFGGCLVKALGWSKGNLEDADTIAWPESLSELKLAYPDVKKVVPGHGKIGGMDLIDYSIELFTKK
ncbi:subclass B1 metallo-beta-lactamase [Flammeovirga yaeyamensis]|uniref:beta-lactamase n=1 Tax=Flammeovirga yaeyamensis TaxID=367791 RepID=A0AAX1NCB1_9BACT|nr:MULTISPECIES: subclass B1 metallo-beta-lactamase [Flammeovirga]ANQ48861.1 subclass B1 metallo-beta-lactamase [Flammeovirga sp. MY04]MBB3698942.1 metallo-beta-lactamase class B [Flammeovirga yaeyamensis]NMF36376.1 subclass B1 metallo-beta-lactamase [Flammeovirga yaeyamensis]QWG03663.1 subclass B1 metallo-beta-lactamase [Flammeovirga yaeyamensis]